MKSSKLSAPVGVKTLCLSAGLLAALCLSAGAAKAAVPTATGLPAGFSFLDYTGPTVVGLGQVNASNTLYYVDEKTVGNLKSWYIFFEPTGVQNVTATLSFDAPIVNVLTTQTALAASDATYGIDIDHDGVFDDYASSTFIGPEAGDTTSFSAGSHLLTIRWSAGDPGDHVRVLTSVTAVPEPAACALLLAGLGVLGFVARRRG